MFAVVRTGGKQYRVSDGETLHVEKLPGDVGQTIELGDVLLVGADADVRIGRPTVPGAKVSAEIVKQGRARKLIVFKYKRRKRYRRKRGHRQSFTAIRITAISA